MTTQANNRVTVVYITGYGYSGSTVLDMLFATHPEFVGCGELVHFSNAAFFLKRRCACGQLIKDCLFWSQVYDDWRSQIGSDGLSEFNRAVTSLETITALPRLFVALRKSGRFPVYAQGMEAMYRAIRKVSGKPIVVDSSKHPVRALLLASLPSVDLCLVHLVRDGRAVCRSALNGVARKTSAKPKGPRKSVYLARFALRWMLMNVTADWVRARASVPSCRILYEQLMAEPEMTLGNVGQALGLDMSAVIETVSMGLPIETGHIFAGNRVRKSGAIRLKMDQSWLHDMHTNDRRFVWGMTWPLAYKYGYRRNVKVQLGDQHAQG